MMRTIKLQVILIFFLVAFSGIAIAGPGQKKTSGEKIEILLPVEMPETDYTLAELLDKAYEIGAGDLIEISVWKEESLTKELTVLPDGKVAFPLIGEIRAAGQTVDVLKSDIEEKLEKYIPNPVVSVVIKKPYSLQVFVIGKVAKPGRYGLSSNVDVLQALAIAGGLNSFAKSSKIKIFRRKGYATEVIPFNYDQVTDGEHLEQNIYLVRGDIIVVN